MSFIVECCGEWPALRCHKRGYRPYLSVITHQRHLYEEHRGKSKHSLIAIQDEALSSNVPIAVDGREFIYVPELCCAAEIDMLISAGQAKVSK